MTGPQAAVPDPPARSLRRRVVGAALCLCAGQLFAGVSCWIVWLNEDQFRGLGIGVVIAVSVLLGLFVGGIAAGDELFGGSSADTSPRPVVVVPAPGRHKRGYQPPRPVDTSDQDLAGRLGRDQWSTVARRLRRRRGRQVLRRVAFLPVFVVATVFLVAAGVGEWADVLPDSWVRVGGPFVAGAVALVWIVHEVRSTIALWQGQLHVVHGVVAGAELVKPKEAEDLAEVAAGLDGTSVTLDDPSFEVLGTDGVLVASPLEENEDVLEAVAGDHTGPRRAHLRCPRRLARQLREQDRVVLLSLGDKRVVARLRDLVQLPQVR